MRTIRVVSPFRPFVAESDAHKLLGAFDWIQALRMLAISVDRSCRCETLAITDVDTDLPVPALHFVTTERRLMLWILEVSLRYLESDRFDRDTVMVSPDILIYGDLRPFFGADLGVIVRPQSKYHARPILNGVQWWAIEAQDRLVAFYREALAIATALPANVIRWGADTVPLTRLLSPIEVGIVQRDGLSVHMVEAGGVMESLSALAVTRMSRGFLAPPSIPILDFRYMRKHHMADVFRMTLGQPVPV